MTLVTARTASRLRRFLMRHQVVVFVVGTMLISWMFIPIAEGGLLPHGPMLAAFGVLAIAAGRRGVTGLGRRMKRWRAGWIWYGVAAGLFWAIHAAALAVADRVGLAVADVGSAVSISTVLTIVVPLLLLGGQWEEPGWLGYLAHRLQRTFRSPWSVLLVAGLIRIAWHTPLVLAGTIPWYDYVFGIWALQVILLWLFNRTGGSVLVPMICHLFSNLTMATFRPLVAEPDQWVYWLIVVIIEASVAIGILLATRARPGYPKVARLRDGEDHF